MASLNNNALYALYSIVVVPLARRCYGSSNGGHPMLTLSRRGVQPVILAAALLFTTPNSQAQEKQAAPGTLKIGLLMDSLEMERCQTDLSKVPKLVADLI